MYVKFLWYIYLDLIQYLIRCFCLDLHINKITIASRMLFYHAFTETFIHLRRPLIIWTGVLYATSITTPCASWPYYLISTDWYPEKMKMFAPFYWCHYTLISNSSMDYFGTSPGICLFNWFLHYQNLSISLKRINELLFMIKYWIW